LYVDYSQGGRKEVDDTTGDVLCDISSDGTDSLDGEPEQEPTEPQNPEIPLPEIEMQVYRDLKSYDVSRERGNRRNSNLDTVLLINKKTGEVEVFLNVQTVADYPSTLPDYKTFHPDCFKDTVAATDFTVTYKTTTGVAHGPAAVIGNTRTIDGKPIDANGETKNGITEGKTLWHSSVNPSTHEEYNFPYSKACFIPKTGNDNQRFFDTLESWGAKDGYTFSGSVYVNKPWESGR
jgi:hypothetical protein